MNWLRMLRVVVGLELAQRVRSVAFYVLLAIVAVVVGGIVVVLYTSLLSWPQGQGDIIFSTTIFLVLLVASLVTPALSGGSINGDRDAGVLASTQVTQVTTSQLVLGKVLASWIASLGFLAVCVPFLVWAAFMHGLRPEVVAISIPILIAEIGVISAIGVGLSGLIRKPVLSIVATYLVVAALQVGTLIVFAVGSIALQAPMQQRQIEWEWDEATDVTTCVERGTYEMEVPRPDRVWPVLAANPYVIMSDALPVDFSNGYPSDLFGSISVGVRMAQEPPQPESCAAYGPMGAPQSEPQDVYERTTPSWFVGLALHLLLATGAVVGAIAATRAPARTLAPGSRIA